MVQYANFYFTFYIIYKMLKFSKISALILSIAVSFSAFAVVDLNKATQAELESVKGIGPSTAKAIVAYRTSTGGFKSVDELKNVKGFGAKRIAKLASELSVNGVSTPATAVETVKNTVAKETKNVKAMAKDAMVNQVNNATNAATNAATEAGNAAVDKMKNKAKSMMPF
jgi:competence protein ComEA